MSPRAYCALQCAVPAILIILDRRGGSTAWPKLDPPVAVRCMRPLFDLPFGKAARSCPPLPLHQEY